MSANVDSFFTGFSQYQTIGMKQLYEIFQLATDELKQPPIVIDADDLLQDPGMNIYFQVLTVLY